MNVPLNLHMDKPAFLTWVQGREQRYELAGSHVVMMTGGSRGHAIVTRRLANALEQRLDQSRWAVLTSDFGVDLGPSTIRYPDVVVDVAGGQLKDLTATAPILIGEVLSPTSATDDLGEKAKEYLGLESLCAYLVFAQDEAKVWVWLRGEAGFSTPPEALAHPNAVIHIAALGISLPLSEIYPHLKSDVPRRSE
ncbi:MAG TPA: Uma2 family endonuclease [Xanthobacteraceae bacterium]|jgi:Uma2 family endonuclease